MHLALSLSIYIYIHVSLSLYTYIYIYIYIYVARSQRGSTAAATPSAPIASAGVTSISMRIVYELLFVCLLLRSI